MKKLNACTRRVPFISLFRNNQLLPAGKHARHLFLCVAWMAFLILPSLSAAQTGITEKRNLDKNLYEKCFTSDFGSSDEAENCTSWIAQSACDGVYVDNRGDIESFTARENLLTYLKSADQKVAKMKGCDTMGQRRLILSLVMRDTNATEREQLGRWDRILKDMPKLLPEQRFFLCEAAAQSDQFSQLMQSKSSRNAIALCTKDMDASSAETVHFLELLSLEAPELIQDDAMAALVLRDISNQRYETARNRLDGIDLKRLSSGIRDALLARVAPLGQVLFKEGLNDALRPHVGIVLKTTPVEARRLALWQALMHEKDAPVAWYAELEAVQYLQNGDTMGVAKRAVGLVSASKSKASSDYLKRLVQHGVATHNLALLKRLALEFGVADGAARSAVTKDIYLAMSSAILDMTAVLLQTSSPKGKGGGVTDEDIQVLKSLIRLAQDAPQAPVQLRLGEVLAMRGEHAEALRLWYEVTASGQDAASVQEAWFLAIVTLRQTKQQAEADKQLEAFESRYPSSPWLGLLR